MDRNAALPGFAPPAPPPRPGLFRRLLEELKGGDLRGLLPRLRPHRGKLAVACAALLGSTGLGLVFPLVVGSVVDSAFEKADEALINRTAMFLAGVFVIQAVLNWIHGYLLGVTGERVVAKLRSDLFSSLLTFPPAFFADRRTGELVSRLTGDVALLHATLSLHVIELVRQSLIVLGAGLILLLTNPQLTVVTLGVVPLVVFTAHYFGKKLQQSTLAVVDQVAEATAIAEESFGQIRVVQSFVREDYERERYDRRMDSAVRVAMRRAVIRGFFFSAIGFAGFGASVVVVWIGGRMVLAGDLTPGSLLQFLILSGMAASAVSAIGSLWTAYKEATGSATRVFHILKARPKLGDPEQPRELPQPVRGEVAFDNVWFRYEPPAELPLMGQVAHVSAVLPFLGAGPGVHGPVSRKEKRKKGKGEEEKPAVLPQGMIALPGMMSAAGFPAGEAPQPPPEWVLRGITVRVQPGETVALVGPSGAGKTTMASLVPRFWDPQQGSITLDGIELRDLRLADLRLAVGVVPQETLLFHGSVRENIAYGRLGATDEEVMAAARTAHAHEFIQMLPEGYETKVGERGVKLSGGQRQRVALARAILKDPAVLILDEATSSLDAESEALIEDAMNHLLQNRTTFIIAHRLSTVRRANRVLVLDRGVIVEEGSHTELVAQGGLYARLYSRQFSDDPDAGSEARLVAAL